jgi:hypothetical protein
MACCLLADNVRRFVGSYRTLRAERSR